MSDRETHSAFATGYRADIDGLRALAVLAVIFFHAGFRPFGGGFVGVDVFFVISGFLITSIITKELARDEFSIAGFYERRIRRIFPALFFTLLGITPLVLAILLPVETLVYGQTLIATASFAANLYFWRTAGYFGPDAERNPLLHTWSLAVEEQFYIVFPIALLLLLRVVRPRAAVAWLGAALLGSLALAEWQVHSAPVTAFYLLPTRAWELLLGAVLALARLPAPSGRRAVSCGVLGLALIGGAAVGYSPNMDFPGLSAVPPCLGTALLLYAGSRTGTPIASALSSAPIRFVGKISYSLYLWHLPLLVLARIELDRELRVAESWALIALAVAIAALSWKFVETPFRRMSLGRSRRVIATGVIASFVFCAAGLALLASGGAAGRFPPAVVIADAAAADEVYPASCVGPNAAGGDRCRDVPFDLLVWGDSHAAHLFAGLERRAGEAGLKAQLQWVGGCPPALDAVPVVLPPASSAAGTDEPKLERSCTRWNRAVLEVVRAATDVKAVALAGAWSFWSEGLDIGTGERRYLADGGTDYSVAESRRVLREGLSRTVAELRGRGLEVLLLAQVPDNEIDPPHCLALAYLGHRDPAECGRRSAEAIERLSWSRGMLRAIAAEHGAYVLDATAKLCGDARCTVAADGVPIYRDADHLTAFGAQLVVDGAAPEFFRAVRHGQR